MAISALAVRSYSTVTTENEGKLMADPRLHRRGTDTLIRYVGPTNTSTGAAIPSGGGVSATLRLFDAGKQGMFIVGTTRLRSDVAAAGTALQIPAFNAINWIEATDTIEVDMDNGLVHTSVVSGLVPLTSYDTVNLVTPLSAAASAGSEIRLIRKGIGGTRIPAKAFLERWEIGDTLEIETNTVGTFDVVTVTQFRPTMPQELNLEATATPALDQEVFDVLTFSPSFSVAVNAHRKIRRKLGNDIAMTQYGTAVAGADDWGWEGLIPDTMTNLRPGMVLECEVRFNGGAGLADVRTLMLPVVG